ncbi:Protein OSB3, chloroplastic/mitochondrial [Quillaja saponaria]|uniref:Protein OSB3, chloroplastic/mitochondrial n=1 Tax=Quillaja saponaria TaxID=32244 RepID=A0AAD7M423_QUISA|nr:Protein OSB3, chloroplastic/mitochondrial [Quillaja saponaria]
MNSLCRALIQYASSPSSRQRLLFHPTIFILQSYSTAAATRSKYKPLQTSSIPQPPTNIDDIERPREIPFQPKISNSVNLIGLVHKPVHFQTSADGRTWAGTIITREQSSDCPSLLIPIVFEGDLAHIAACHLKEKDCIHVDGQLSADLSYLDTKQAQDNLQIVVSSLNFVQGYSQIQNISALRKQEESFSSSVASEKHDIKQSWKDLLKKTNVKQDVIDIDKAWKDLLSKPDEWWDIQSSEEKAKGAAFERKKNGELLFIDNSTPKWIQEKLELITFDRRCDPINWKSGAKKTVVSVLSSWRDLIDHPKQWWDFRDNKVNPKYPDFKSKDGDLALWLDKAPRWVLSKLEEIEFDVQIVKSKQASECGAKKTVGSVLSSWRDLIDHPKQWWDFRDNKVNPKYPDFKSKDGDLALWLDKAPRWVLSKLEEIEFDVQIVKSKQASECGTKKTVVSVLSSWRDLIDHPKQWWDCRGKKVNPKYPDFKSKDGNLALWLDKAPQLVLSKLEGIEFDIQIVKSEQGKERKSDESWRNLVENPDKWWDNRLGKLKERSPDFKHKETQEALWLSDSPSWVMSKLPPIKPERSVETSNRQALFSSTLEEKVDKITEF